MYFILIYNIPQDISRFMQPGTLLQSIAANAVIRVRQSRMKSAPAGASI
jgi:hypothetical protein